MRQKLDEALPIEHDPCGANRLVHHRFGRADALSLRQGGVGNEECNKGDGGRTGIGEARGSGLALLLRDEARFR